jgi:hypothetical protein
MNVFVFGSNTRGIHGAGAALHAREIHGAIYGQGVGLQGRSYAIPTKDDNLHPLPLEEIARHVHDFIEFAKRHTEMAFKVTAIGCGLAGYKPEQIAPMFAVVPSNCHLPTAFVEVLQKVQHTEEMPQAEQGKS